jgi:hypothetical protein
MMLMIIFVTKMFVEIGRDDDTVDSARTLEAEPLDAIARTAITGSIRAIVSDRTWHCFEGDRILKFSGIVGNYNSI